MLELLVGIEEFDGHKSVRLFDADGSTLVEALDLINDCDDGKRWR